MNSKLRLRILKKIAQTTGDTPTSGVAQTMTVSAPTVTMEAAYPNARSGYDDARARIVFALGDLLNKSINLATAGKYNIQSLRNKSWQITPDEFPSPDQKNLAMFFKKVFISLFNNGQAFPQKLTSEQLTEKAEDLLQSQEFRNLSQVSPTGPIAIKITSNLQSEVRRLLSSLNPKAPTALA